jgi:hypothetical protein
MITTGTLRHFRGYIVDKPGHLRDAKRLHADVYLGRGFIEDHHVDKAGAISLEADPHQQHSQYFVACEEVGKKEIVRVTARQIRAKKERGFDSFPILRHAHIYPEMRQRVYKFKPENCVEISGLAKQRGTTTVATLIVYRMMWFESLRRGDKLWLMACSPSLFQRLKQLFGPNVVQMGERTPYVGEDVIPAMVVIDEALYYLHKNAQTLHPTKRLLYRAVLRFFTDGLPVENFSSSKRARLRADEKNAR